MRIKNIAIFLFISVCTSLTAKEVQTVEFLNTPLALNSSVDYYINGVNTVTTGASIDFRSNDAWVFFMDMRPSEVVEDYLDFFTVKGEPFEVQKNGRIEMYKEGTVVIPHDKATYVALELYSERAQEGDYMEMPTDSLNINLGDMNNNITSFVLKRGYMATMANDSTGTGYSRVFIADTVDLVIDELPELLDNKISFIKVVNWRWPSKKGWCSSGRGKLEETNLTQSTWMYSWSADDETTPNYEFVPIKQTPFWPNWDKVFGQKNVTHLLGFNEPDRPDQANTTVEVAIGQWPNMLKTGLRLGSPALASDINWLRNFIAECDKRNYRVDFVAIHAYWALQTNGSADPQKWYNNLKSWYEAGGKRPLWITEWNNGANWTNESWPSNEDEQKQKQLKDLKIILQVLDTCSFVERYSIYNWVEDKRAMILADANGNPSLTPAGEYYRDNKPSFAYDQAVEVVPTYKTAVPNLNAAYNPVSKTSKLSWVDYNGELSDQYVLARKTDEGNYETIFTTNNTAEIREYDDILDFYKSTKYTYRLTLSSELGGTGTTGYYSNTPILEVGVAKSNSDVRYGLTRFSDNSTKTMYFEHEYNEVPAVVYAASSYQNRIQLAYSISPILKNYFVFQSKPFPAQDNTTIGVKDSIPFIAAKKESGKWGELAYEAGTQNRITNVWKEVTFKEAFANTPIVFVSPVSMTVSYPVYARVRNVTKEGFEVCFTREQVLTGDLPTGSINYFAIEQGSTMIANNEQLKVGLSPVESVGELSSKYTIEFGEEVENPVFYGALQSFNDVNITMTLRYQTLKPESAVVFKQRETSKSGGTAKKDQVGWMVISGGDPGVGVDDYFMGDNNSLLIYPTITSGELNVDAVDGTIIDIYNMTGVQVKSEVLKNAQLDVSDIANGVYIIRTDKGQNQRFIKVN